MLTRPDGEVRSIETFSGLKLSFLRGDGVEDNPYRLVDQYIRLDGDSLEFICENDSWRTKSESMKNK